MYGIDDQRGMRLMAWILINCTEYSANKGALSTIFLFGACVFGFNYCVYVYNRKETKRESQKLRTLLCIPKK